MIPNLAMQSAEAEKRLMEPLWISSQAVEEKGYVLEDVKISFDPPSFGKVTVLGFCPLSKALFAQTRCWF